ncbi:BspA family leucine-rich repeat surface protein [Flavobacterium sp. Arc2]|uniref:BspA family leucine-rich repeat surface protein n=1 Tax=Flavobacterium sp. Arc2 TaxID=3046685 RepID=UPI00352CE6D0
MIRFRNLIRLTKIIKGSVFYFCFIFLLISFSGKAQTPFTTTWQTDGANNIIIPLTGNGYDFTIDWGDSSIETKVGSFGNISHTYSTAGIKTVSITPNVITGFPRIYINNFGNRNYLKSVDNWGSGQWSTMANAFYGASVMQITASDIPDLSNVSSFSNAFINCTALTGNSSMADWRFTTDINKSIDMSAMFQSASNFNQDISNWNMERVTNLRQMFNGASAFDQDLSSWEVSNVLSMSYLFGNTTKFNNLGNDLNWGAKLANVTDMNNMFNNAQAFNNNISGWDVGNVTNMNAMFQSTKVFNQDISSWNVGNVTNMASMFYAAQAFNENLSTWDIANVTNMSSMFRQTLVYNQPLDAWGVKTAKVTNMQDLFRDSKAFNQTINSWDVSKVTNMQYMFYNCVFDQDLNSWDVSSLTNGYGIFQNNTLFNGNISGWQFTTDVSKSVNLTNLFASAVKFNQDITNWNVSRVTNMSGMFNNAQAFSQDISGWNVANVTDMNNMFNNTQVFNQNISGWNVGNVTNMSSMFRNADAFNLDISVWNVSNVMNMSYMFADNNIFNQDLSNWDVSSVINMSNMFDNASVFNSPLNWGLKTGNVTNMVRMFAQAPQFNQDIDGWDVSKVTSTNWMFYRTNSFNQSLNSWNVGSLIDPRQMFQECTSFNGNISSWVFTTDPTKNINASSMFQSTTSFDQDISNWNVERFTNMSGIFQSATSFNQNIGSWNVANVTNMNAMFNNAIVFAQDISGWNVGNVTVMSSMFQNADAFNINISGWNVSNVTNMVSMFNSNNIFNQDLSNWDVSSVTNMEGMFQQMPLFNAPLNWGTKTGNVTNMRYMFYNTPLFNQDINSWNVSNVTNFRQMFHNAFKFNQNLFNWQFTNESSKTIDMDYMFYNATSFNQDISTWNISRVTKLYFFLAGGKLSRANYDALLLSWSTLDSGETLVPINLNAHFGSSKYSDTASVLTARNTTLIANKNWTITDGGIDADAIVPFIVSNSLTSNNTTISITFSENVYRTDVGSGSLETTDFLFSLSGGTATLNTTVPSSILASNNLTFVLGLDINGTPNGAEVLTVTPVLNSVFDVSGNAASTTQSNNTAQLNDLSNPIITGPNSETGVSSSIAINENTAAVHTFSANETITWTLGNVYDEALFGIDSSGNLVFTTAPDFENPSSTLNSNTYVVEIVATDAANNSATQTLTITILDIANSTFGTFAAITKQYFTGTHIIVHPTTNNTNPIVYTSDNSVVATVSGSVITFTGVGTANITATQAADANYEGNTVSTLLTVLGKDLVSKYGGISSTGVNYISANGNVGGAFGIDKYGMINNIYDNADAPIIGTAVAGNTKASVSFTAPANTGGSPITSYTAMSSPGSFTGTLIQSGSGTITVNGLTNGTAYTFTVTATNAVGNSVASAASILVTPLPPPSIGDFRGGGVVFYVAPTPTDLDGDGDLDTALVCSIVDQSSGIQWYNGVYTSTGATVSVIGSGGANTAAIIASQGTTTTDYAAGIAHAYSGGGYTDWFLPSSYEMATIITHKGVISSKSVANGGAVVRTDYPNNFYWSSTETSNTTAIVFRINPSGTPPTYGWNKNLLYRVRAVRAF